MNNTNMTFKEPLNMNTFTKKFVESLDPKVKRVDCDGDIELFCYTTCDDNDTEYIKACRGLVFNKDKLVLKAFSYNPEYTADNYEYLNTTYPDTSKLLFFDSFEGALIRVFNVNDKWYISTHRRLDAFRSKWSSRVSFGEYFSKSLEHYYSTNDTFRQRILQSPLEQTSPTSSILDKFISTLDKDKKYTFLLQNNQQNRIVCNPPQYPHVFHVGTFDSDSELDLSISVDLPYPPSHKFNTMDDVFEHVENVLDYTQLQGIIVFDTEKKLQFKIVNREYKYLFELRGNESSIKNRYLQLRMDRVKSEELKKLYPESEPDFDLYENIIYQIAKRIYDSYVDRFIRKMVVTLPSEEYQVLKQCHSWHIEDRSNNRISFNKVMSVLNTQLPPKLNKMIRRQLLVIKKENKEEQE
jgi:hypothetical protein